MDKDERKELCINDDYSYSVRLKRLRRAAIFSELCKDDIRNFANTIMKNKVRKESTYTPIFM